MLDLSTTKTRKTQQQFFLKCKKRYDLINKRMNVMLKVFPYLFLCGMFYFLPCSDLNYI